MAGLSMLAESLTSNSLIQAFLGSTIFEVLLLLVFQTVNMLKSDADNVDYLFGGITVSTLIFLEFFAWDAIFHENFVQLIVFYLFNATILGYFIFQVATLGVDALLLVQLIVVSMSMFFYLVILSRLSQKFGFRVYRIVGKDPRLRGLFRQFQIFVTLLKLDAFCQLLLVVQNLTLLVRVGPEYWVNVGAPVFIVAVSILGLQAARRENLAATGIFMTLNVVFPAYVGYRTAVILTTETGLPLLPILITIALILLTRIALVIATNLAAKNYGQGLKPAIDLYEAAVRNLTDASAVYGPYEQRRMCLIEEFDWEGTEAFCRRCGGRKATVFCAGCHEILCGHCFAAFHPVPRDPAHRPSKIGELLASVKDARSDWRESVALGLPQGVDVHVDTSRPQEGELQDGSNSDTDEDDAMARMSTYIEDDDIELDQLEIIEY